MSASVMSKSVERSFGGGSQLALPAPESCPVSTPIPSTVPPFLRPSTSGSSAMWTAGYERPAPPTASIGACGIRWVSPARCQSRGRVTDSCRSPRLRRTLAPGHRRQPLRAVPLLRTPPPASPGHAPCDVRARWHGGADARTGTLSPGVRRVPLESQARQGEGRPLLRPLGPRLPDPPSLTRAARGSGSPHQSARRTRAAPAAPPHPTLFLSHRVQLRGLGQEIDDLAAR